VLALAASVLDAPPLFRSTTLFFNPTGATPPQLTWSRSGAA
jgi:hypothetical protein